MKKSKLSQGLSGFSSDYVRYVRPSLGKALRGIQLDLEYFDGKKDTLLSCVDGQYLEILDLTGGYGANLLGHKNIEIQEVAIDAFQQGPPSHLQGTVRRSTVELAKK